VSVTDHGAELERHGYKLSPGTPYPLLHNLEAAAFLIREDQIVGGKIRKYYRITPLGKRALEEAGRRSSTLSTRSPRMSQNRGPRGRRRLNAVSNGSATGVSCRPCGASAGQAMAVPAIWELNGTNGE
jgi:DNA-binding PadR family transcriptional regulator